MSIVTLLTDLGTSTPAVGQVCGVIWHIDPSARLIDLTHDIPIQDLRTAQVVLENAFSYFPDGTIHMAVAGMKPGPKFTGNDANRPSPRPIAAQIGSYLFTGPDNGLITPLVDQGQANRWPIELYHANKTEFWRMGSTVRSPARDIFASLAGHMARGTALSELGDRINDVLLDRIPAPELIGEGWRGQVVQVDHFGNLSMNIKRSHLEGMENVRVLIAGQVIAGLSQTFGDRQPGDLTALIDSSNRLSICVVNGSAAERLGSRAGDIIEVHPL
jgi:S-adenosyl-L-methionine hydrolase (adenosine-forming)